MENYVDFAVQKAVELLAIDSPTGYTAEAEEFVLREFRARLCGGADGQGRHSHRSRRRKHR